MSTIAWPDGVNVSVVVRDDGTRSYGAGVHFTADDPEDAWRWVVDVAQRNLEAARKEKALGTYDNALRAWQARAPQERMGEG